MTNLDGRVEQFVHAWATSHTTQVVFDDIPPDAATNVSKNFSLLNIQKKNIFSYVVIFCDVHGSGKFMCTEMLLSSVIFKEVFVPLYSCASIFRFFKCKIPNIDGFGDANPHCGDDGDWRYAPVINLIFIDAMCSLCRANNPILDH